MRRLIREVTIVLLLALALAGVRLVDVGHTSVPAIQASDPGGSSGGTGGGRT